MRTHIIVYTLCTALSIRQLLVNVRPLPRSILVVRASIGAHMLSPISIHTTYMYTYLCVRRCGREPFDDDDAHLNRARHARTQAYLYHMHTCVRARSRRAYTMAIYIRNETQAAGNRTRARHARHRRNQSFISQFIRQQRHSRGSTLSRHAHGTRTCARTVIHLSTEKNACKRRAAHVVLFGIFIWGPRAQCVHAMCLVSFFE